MGGMMTVAIKGETGASNPARDGAAVKEGSNSEDRRAGQTQLVSEMAVSTARRQHLVSNDGIDSGVLRMTVVLYSLRSK